MRKWVPWLVNARGEKGQVTRVLVYMVRRVSSLFLVWDGAHLACVAGWQGAEEPPAPRHPSRRPRFTCRPSSSRSCGTTFLTTTNLCRFERRSRPRTRSRSPHSTLLLDHHHHLLARTRDGTTPRRLSSRSCLTSFRPWSRSRPQVPIGCTRSPSRRFSKIGRTTA